MTRLFLGELPLRDRGRGWASVGSFWGSSCCTESSTAVRVQLRGSSRAVPARLIHPSAAPARLIYPSAAPARLIYPC